MGFVAGLVCLLVKFSRPTDLSYHESHSQCLGKLQEQGEWQKSFSVLFSRALVRECAIRGKNGCDIYNLLTPLICQYQYSVSTYTDCVFYE